MAAAKAGLVITATGGSVCLEPAGESERTDMDPKSDSMIDGIVMRVRRAWIAIASFLTPCRGIVGLLAFQMIYELTNPLTKGFLGDAPT
jgi:hypothetical protein